MDGLANLASVVFTRFTTNVQSTFANLTPEKFIRLVIIAGTCTPPSPAPPHINHPTNPPTPDMLLRPYIIKLGARSQMQSHEQESFESEQAAKAAISPNELRGRVQIPEDSDDEDEGESTAADWGKKARRRQRDMIKKLLEAEEKRLQESREEEEDKDIEEFLVEE